MAEENKVDTPKELPTHNEDGIKIYRDLEEIFEHNTKKSMWLLIDFKVYDVTDFKHPGGKQILLANAGQDATTQFEDINHSSDAMGMMLPMLVGIYEQKGGNPVKEVKKVEEGADPMSKLMLVTMFVCTMTLLYCKLTGTVVPVLGIKFDL